MHKCLQVNEILDNIFEVLLQAYPGKTILDRHSLFSVIRTCRSFTGAATRILWRDLYNIVPLILAMPEDLWEVETLGEGSPRFTPRTISFKRDVVPSHWERFDAYAPLVKHLGITERNEVSSSNFMVLHDNIRKELEKRATELLPNLTTIVASTNDLLFTPLLLTTQVRKVKIHMHTSQIESLYHLLQVDIPLQGFQLKILHLKKTVHWDALSQVLLLPALSELLSELDLEEFECDWYHVSNTMMEHLLKMPSLRSMTVFKSIPALYEVLKKHQIAWPSLRRIKMWTDDLGPDVLARTLELLRPTRLEELWILPDRSIKVFDSATLKEFISAIAAFCTPDHFTHLGLEGGGGTLRMKSVPGFIDYAELAMSWPHLQVFVVDIENADPDFKPRTTLRGLLWFATYCRQLRSLNFQFSGIDSFSDGELALASKHQLRELAVGNSTISDPDKVAAFIDTLFPNLMLFYWMCRGEDDPNTELWREVEMKRR